MAKVLIPLSQAAITLKTPYRAIYDLALSGRLGEPERIGNRLYVSRDAVEKHKRESQK